MAEYGAGISSHDDYLEILSFRKKHRVGLKVVGEGSNIIPRSNVQGLVVKMIRTGISQLDDGDDTVLVEVSAGENWNDFVFFALEKGWYGLENLVKIPGSVGAAPIQNIGAYGAEVADFIEYVLVWDARGKERTLSRDECLFGYRSSIFQRDTELTVAGVGLRLGKIPKPNISYPDVSNALSDRPESSITPQIVASKIAEIRAAKLPDPKTYPNVGSFFKNPLLDRSGCGKIKRDWFNGFFSGQWLQNLSRRAYRQSGVQGFNRRACLLLAKAAPGLNQQICHFVLGGEGFRRKGSFKSS